MNRCDFKKNGFTLVELLAVIAVIILLAGLVTGLSGLAASKSATAKAEAELERIKLALEEYRSEKGSYPTGIGGALTNYGENIVIEDPWGNDYRYDQVARFEYRLRSIGPDGEADTDDDIGNF